MLISPPFLPAVNNAADEAWVDTAMSPIGGGEGSYPLSKNLGWHGGVHLQAPSVSGGYLPVRAIADGQIVYIRLPTAVNQNPDDPLNYDAGQRLSGWTSDGCVIISHETEIGEGTDGSIRYFSIYMHLQGVPPRLALGRVFRKDKIGDAGLIYGKPGCIHFEIVCDDQNLKKIVGRESSDLPLDKNGSATTLYGDIYFHLPAGTSFMSDNPLKSRKPGVPEPSVVHTSDEELFVGMRYAGSGFVSTFRVNGSEIGTELIEADFEYDIFKTASKLAPRRPSAALELLRFGRVIGSDSLDPVDTAHWRRVNFPGGQGWVNLSPLTIHKFSDADFPQWRGWALIDDSADADSRMDSPTIKGWLRNDQGEELTVERVQSATSSQEVKAKLRKVICKIPTEWEKSTIDKRWGWLKEKSNLLPEPLAEEDFNRLKSHIDKLCFWEEAVSQLGGLDASHWHFHPIEFIKQFRKCGWLSEQELVQMIPKTVQKLTGTAFHTENLGGTAVIQPRVRRWKLALNRTLRKYNMDRPIRRMYFFANVWEETGCLRLMVEGNGAQASYAPWYGRGLIQLTHLANYQWYGTYRGFPHTLTTGPYGVLGWDPDQHISQNDDNCIDTAVYWINPSATSIGRNILREADLGYSQNTSVQTARGTNGNVPTKNINGLDGRLQIAVYLRHALLDAVREQNTESLTFAWRRSTQKTGTVVVNNQVKHVYEDGNHTIDVDIATRRPL